MENNTNQEKPKPGCIILLIVFILIFIWWVLKPSEKEVTENKEEKQKIELEEKIKKTEANLENKDYSVFKYSFPNSSYTYDVKIIAIETKLRKNEFESKEDEYSVAKKVDGYILSMDLEFTNPYDKEMMAPIPNYYAITSLDKQYFSGSTTYSRSCGCDIDNSTEVTDSRGKNLWQVSEGRCGSGDYCIKFQPKEKKKFKVTFTDPIIATQKKIILIAFNQTYREAGSTRNRDIGFVLNLETRKVDGIKYL